MRLSKTKMKPLNTNWLVQIVSKFENNHVALKHGWAQTGMTDNQTSDVCL